MKTWNSYGSEHSANLVMIGSFKDAASAESAKAAIDALTDYVSSSQQDFSNATRYPDNVFPLLEKLKFHSISPSEFEQFRYDIQSEVKGSKVVIGTDEIEVSAFLKLLFDKGARIEVYSAHQYPDSKDTKS